MCKCTQKSMNETDSGHITVRVEVGCSSDEIFSEEKESTTCGTGTDILCHSRTIDGNDSYQCIGMCRRSFPPKWVTLQLRYVLQLRNAPNPDSLLIEASHIAFILHLILRYAIQRTLASRKGATMQPQGTVQAEIEWDGYLLSADEASTAPLKGAGLIGAGLHWVDASLLGAGLPRVDASLLGAGSSDNHPAAAGSDSRHSSAHFHGSMRAPHRPQARQRRSARHLGRAHGHGIRHGSPQNFKEIVTKCALGAKGGTGRDAAERELRMLHRATNRLKAGARQTTEGQSPRVGAIGPPSSQVEPPSGWGSLSTPRSRAPHPLRPPQGPLYPGGSSGRRPLPSPGRSVTTQPYPRRAHDELRPSPTFVASRRVSSSRTSLGFMLPAGTTTSLRRASGFHQVCRRRVP